MNAHSDNKNLRHQGPEVLCPKRSVPALQIIVLSMLFCIPRIPFLGHILSLDEAWILSALRSAAGGQALYSDQLYRHPPLYLLLGFALSPLRAAFEYRLELLTLLFSLASLIVLVKFTARYYGHRIALYTGIVFALAPGPVFFDTWVKRDCLVTLLGLLAIWAVLEKKEYWAGVMLGLAFLSKETAIFFGLAIFFLLLFDNGQGKIWLRLLKVYGLTAIIAGGWYLFVAQYTLMHWSFFHGKNPNASSFATEWWYYFAKLQPDLSTTGLLFFVIGLFSILYRMIRLHTPLAGLTLKKISLLPLSLLLPAYLILSLARGKPPWMIISLYPFLALVSGIGIAAVIKFVKRLTVKIPRSAEVVPIAIPLLVTLMLGTHHIGVNYAQQLDNISPGTLRPIQNAYVLAEALNKFTSEGESVLFFPDLYRGKPEDLDPILYWQLNKKMNIMRSVAPSSLDSFKEIINRFHVSWVILYPLKGSGQERLLTEIQEEHELNNYWTRGALLLKVDEIWNERQSELEEKPPLTSPQ
jgi:hypothetical protein